MFLCMVSFLFFSCFVLFFKADNPEGMHENQLLLVLYIPESRQERHIETPFRLPNRWNLVAIKSGSLVVGKATQA